MAIKPQIEKLKFDLQFNEAVLEYSITKLFSIRLRRKRRPVIADPLKPAHENA
jgi:hypothetical protein